MCECSVITSRLSRDYRWRARISYTPHLSTRKTRGALRPAAAGSPQELRHVKRTDRGHRSYQETGNWSVQSCPLRVNSVAAPSSTGRYAINCKTRQVSEFVANLRNRGVPVAGTSNPTPFQNIEPDTV